MLHTDGLTSRSPDSTCSRVSISLSREFPRSKDMAYIFDPSTAVDQATGKSRLERPNLYLPQMELLYDALLIDLEFVANSAWKHSSWTMRS